MLKITPSLMNHSPVPLLFTSLNDHSKVTNEIRTSYRVYVHVRDTSWGLGELASCAFAADCPGSAGWSAGLNLTFITGVNFLNE